MTDINEDFEVSQDKSEEEVKAEIEAENRRKYAELAAKANAENKVIYQHENGEYELVDQKTYNTCIFDGEDWVEDIKKINEINDEKIKLNKEICLSLISDASTEISILQDIIDLDMAEDGDPDKLKQWRKYRVLLSRVDTSVEEMELPEKPD